MSTNVTVPELGESVVEATVLRWLVREGDPVKAGQVVVELETEKVNLEVSAERSGVLARIVHREGDDVKIGDLLAVIETEEERRAAESEGERDDGGRKTDDGRQKTEDGGEKAKSAQRERREGEPEKKDQAPRATPVARRYAEEFGVDLARVQPASADRRITREDVEQYLREQKPTGTEERSASARTGREPERPAAQATGAAEIKPPEAAKVAAGESKPSVVEERGARDGREQRVRMSRRRQTIARRLVEAQRQAAMLTTFNEIDMSAVMELRKRYRESFKERYGVGLGITSFFVKAAIGALKDFPRLNAELDGDEIILKHYYDIGIAVGATEGLVVPVLREADRLSFVEIEKAIAEFAKKAENGTLSLEDLRGGSFTITNGGVFGSLLSTPILNPPQVGILGLHKIEERPIAREGQVVVRPMMYVALSYDHRIVDGREAVQFLVRIKQLVEDPSALLLEA